jgi:DNA-binding CsgD family transcriptional regulator
MLQITPSERQTLQLLADETPTNEIACCLGIALSEVGSHLAVLFARMGVSTRTEAVSKALQRGLLMSRCARDKNSPASGVDTRRKVMRFALLYRSGKRETNEPPSPQEMQAVGKLVQEMANAGVLLGTEGFEPSEKGARIRINAGTFTVNDGPFTDGNSLIDGYAVVKVNSKAEAIEWSQRFLTAVGQGESEIRQLREMP